MSLYDDWGTYTLLFSLDGDATITVGALGEIDFPSGAYAYTGSAGGRSGFTRLQHHDHVATGDSTTTHWHIDYLLSHPDAALHSVITATGVDVECRIARELDAEPTLQFGCSDCKCESHLHHNPTLTELVAAVDTTYNTVEGATPVLHSVTDL